MTLVISVFALLATCYQLYLQRMHNEKSLRPLGQIDLPDYKKQLAVYVRNNGLGPLIIDQLTFIKGDKQYATIDACLDLNPKSYMRVTVNDAVKRVVLPNSYLTVFETQFDDSESEAKVNHARNQLSPIILRVDGRDMYDNKITFERDFQWFARHMLKEDTEQ